jgi:hypothetical protein
LEQERPTPGISLAQVLQSAQTPDEAISKLFEV